MSNAIVLAVRKALGIPAAVAIVGQNIYPGEAPEDQAAPFILIYRSGTENRQLLGGSADMPRARLSFQCVGRTKLEAEEIGDALNDGLKNVTNEIIYSSTSPTEPLGIITVVQADFDDDGYSDARQAFTRTIDFYIEHRDPPAA